MGNRFAVPGAQGNVLPWHLTSNRTYFGARCKSGPPGSRPVVVEREATIGER